MHPQPSYRQSLQYPNENKYNDRFADQGWEYRTVRLCRETFRSYRQLIQSKNRRAEPVLLTEREWRALGLMMSPGWIHFMVWKREPNVLCFRREKK